uniref:NADP-dependent oxidoreductase domain-containing protein n=1 Tax=Schizophyllum commune (strain H4-8 / FGSC 9210) TaxID=578458 RepID=D8PU91_SCHCM
MSYPKKVPYVRLGNSGLKVSKIILGCLSYGSPEYQPWVLGEEEGIKHIKVAYDLGINTFDTANVYSNGLSEVVLGKAIKANSKPMDALKLYSEVKRNVNEYFTLDIDPDTTGYVNQHGLSRKHIFDSVKHSLERLQLDYIDVLQCHRFDKDTPIAETMEALHDVVKAGWVRYIGMSSCWAYQCAYSFLKGSISADVSPARPSQCHADSDYAIQNKLTPFISMQNHYSLIYREEEREMFPTLQQYGVGSIPWSPLGRGVLTRPISQRTKRGETDEFIGFYKNAKESMESIVNRVEELAKKKGCSMAQLALAWIMARPGVSAPIVGTTSLDNLRDLAGAVDVKLSAEEMKYMEEPYTPQAILGHF